MIKWIVGTLTIAWLVWAVWDAFVIETRKVKRFEHLRLHGPEKEV